MHGQPRAGEGVSMAIRLPSNQLSINLFHEAGFEPHFGPSWTGRSWKYDISPITSALFSSRILFILICENPRNLRMKIFLGLDRICPTPRARIARMKNQNLNYNGNQNQIVTNDPPSSDYGATSPVSYDRIRQNQKETFIFEPVAPCPEPVAIGELLTEIEATITRHVVLSDAAATALAVWVVHTYVYDARDTVAYVAIESPEKRCGKTTLLTALAAMADKPLIAANVTVGALFRSIDACGPTLFIDEADTFLAGNSTMRGIINSGNTWRTAYVLRLSRAKGKSKSVESRRELGDFSSSRDGERGHPKGWTPSEGHDSGLERYSCWCPKAIAMIGKVPDTVADRSIVVSMVRKLVTEKREPLAALNVSDIKAKCARFALDQRDAIGQSEKIHGEGLNDRAADTFDPLYVIARLAGSEWEQKLHAAALALCAGGVQATGAIAELLLDIHTIFLFTEQKKMFTRGLLACLQEDEFALKANALNYLTLDECGLSDALRPYGIKSSTIRIGKDVMRGYLAEDFSDAVARYVPKADVEARIQEIKRQGNLWAEAKAAKDSEWHAIPMG